VIENIDLDAPDAPVSGAGLHHLNITASAGVQDWLVDRILGVLPVTPNRCSC
jgi:hypothetical protein